MIDMQDNEYILEKKEKENTPHHPVQPLESISQNNTPKQYVYNYDNLIFIDTFGQKSSITKDELTNKVHHNEPVTVYFIPNNQVEKFISFLKGFPSQKEIDSKLREINAYSKDGESAIKEINSIVNNPENTVTSSKSEEDEIKDLIRSQDKFELYLLGELKNKLKTHKEILNKYERDAFFAKYKYGGISALFKLKDAIAKKEKQEKKEKEKKENAGGHGKDLLIAKHFVLKRTSESECNAYKHLQKLKELKESESKEGELKDGKPKRKTSMEEKSLYELIPECLVVGNGAGAGPEHYIIMDNATKGMKDPKVFDIKIGAKTCSRKELRSNRHKRSYFSSLKKKAKMVFLDAFKSKSSSNGYRIEGVTGVNKINKRKVSKYIRQLCTRTIEEKTGIPFKKKNKEKLSNHIRQLPTDSLNELKTLVTQSSDMTKSCIRQLASISTAVGNSDVVFVGSSIMIVTEGNTIKAIKVIDLAHPIYPGKGINFNKYEENYIKGIDSLATKFNTYVVELDAMEKEIEKEISVRKELTNASVTSVSVPTVASTSHNVIPSPTKEVSQALQTPTFSKQQPFRTNLPQNHAPTTLRVGS